MPGTKPRVVVVEDERPLREDMVEYLSAQGFHAKGAENSTALDAILAEGAPYDLAVLDINLPGESGFGIAARLRQQGGIGIVMVSARSSIGDKVVGLEVGADAYLVKPVDLRELEAQLRSLLRRVGPRRETAEPPPEVAAAAEQAWVFHSVQRFLVSPEGASVPLTSAEFSLLRLLLERPGEPVSRQTISRALYRRDHDAGDRAIDSLVRRLRLKIEEHAGGAAPIRSAHAIGYVFAAPAVVR